MINRSDDPYLYTGSTVLRNKLNIRDAEKLGLAEDRQAGFQYAALMDGLPKGPFTFDTLKDIHRTLFQDVYQWAGEPRTIAIFKETGFTRPDRIETEGKAIFDRLAQANFLTGLDRPQFAAAAADVLRSVNDLHAFREGNGRSQRLLLAAIGEYAGHPMSFDVVTRERMVATSIEASRGDVDGLAHLMDDVTDPRRTTALRTALNAIRQHGDGDWNNLYVATTQAGQTYNGVLVGQAGQDFMMRAKSPAREWVAVGDVRDLPQDARSGEPVSVTATQFSASLTAQVVASQGASNEAPRASVLDTLLKAMRPPSNQVPEPWETKHTPMADRVRAEDERIAKARARPEPSSASETKPVEEPQPDTPQHRPSSGPGPS